MRCSKKLTTGSFPLTEFSNSLCRSNRVKDSYALYWSSHASLCAEALTAAERAKAEIRSCVLGNVGKFFICVGLDERLAQLALVDLPMRLVLGSQNALPPNRRKQSYPLDYKVSIAVSDEH